MLLLSHFHAGPIQTHARVGTSSFSHTPPARIRSQYKNALPHEYPTANSIYPLILHKNNKCIVINYFSDALL